MRCLGSHYSSSAIVELFLYMVYSHMYPARFCSNSFSWLGAFKEGFSLYEIASPRSPRELFDKCSNLPIKCMSDTFRYRVPALERLK